MRPSEATSYRVPVQRGPHGFIRAEYVGLLVVLSVLFGLFSLLSDHFLTIRTFTTLANQLPGLLVISVGMTFVLIVAGIDLSVGSVMAVSGAVLGIAVVDWKIPLSGACLLAMGTGLGFGLFNGLVMVRWKIPSFVVTLGTLEIARGAAYLATGSQTKYIGLSISGISSPLPGIGVSPAFLAAVAVVILGQVLLTRTVYGRAMAAIGANETAASLSGLHTGPVKVSVFALSGLLSGLGSLFHCSRLASADPNAGVGLELSVIAAVVIGGTSLMGGRGSVINSFLGVLIIVVLQAGLAQVGVSEPAKRVITGVVIMVAVIVDAYRDRPTRERRT